MAFSKLYLTNNAAPFTPTNLLGAWEQNSSVTKGLDTVKAGGGTIRKVQFAESNSSPTYDVALYRGVSAPIAAQTLSGTLNLILGVYQDSGSNTLFYYVHCYVTAGDTDTVRGTLLADYFESGSGNSWSGNINQTGQPLASAQTLSSVAASDGDRIVIEIGCRSTSTSGTAIGSLWYGTQNPNDYSEADDLTDNGDGRILAGYIEFSQSITELLFTTRESQLVAEPFLSQGTVGAAISQLAAEPFSPTVQIARVSQLAAESFSSGANTARIGQLALEVWSSGDTDQFVNVFVAGF